MLPNMHQNEISNINGYSNGGKYALIDSAFEQSPSMNEFQNRISNSQYREHNLSDYPLSQRSEDRMNATVDQLVGSNMTYHGPTAGSSYPANINYKNDSYKNVNYKNEDQMNFFKLVALIVVIIILIYGGYWMYHKNS